MKKLLAVFAVLLFAAAVSAQTTSGTITANETWSGTITLTGDVHISSGTVTVSPGAVIKFGTSNDNIVNGSADKIHIIISGDGAMSAVGAADNRITFTTTSPFAAAGSWGKIEMWQLNNTNTTFKFCDFEYGQTSLEFRNATGQTAVSRVDIEDCTIKQSSAASIYMTSGAVVNITRCLFDNCGKGVFIHGSGAVNISYCTFNTMSNAIINAGMAEYPGQVLTIDHCTIYNVDMMLASEPKWWDGYAIFHTNDTYSGSSITNSIIVQATLAGMVLNSWDITRNNNCWYTGMLGLMNIEDGSIGTGSIEGDFSSPIDPLFVDAAGGDFRLATGSACIGAASDGSNMGAWDTESIFDVFGASAAAGFEVLGNPMTAGTEFRIKDGLEASLTIYDMQGRQVHRMEGSGSVAWDGRLDNGSRIGGGIYSVVCRTAQGSTTGRLMVAE